MVEDNNRNNSRVQERAAFEENQRHEILVGIAMVHGQWLLGDW